MNDRPIVEYLRARARVTPPPDLVGSIAEAVVGVPQRRTSQFTLWLPGVAAVGATAVIAVLAILLGQALTVGPSPAPSQSPIPSDSPTESVNSIPQADLVEVGSQVTLDALDQSGAWGTITLTRGPDIAGYPGFTEPDLFLIQVFVDYEPTRVPMPQEFGASDWLLGAADPNAEHFFIAESTNSRAIDESWPAPTPLLGDCAAIEVMSTPCDGWVQFPVTRRDANLELKLAYAPTCCSGGGVLSGADPLTGVARFRVRLPGPAPDPLPSPTPAPGQAGYVEQPGLPFSVLDNAEADALFIDADSCTNPVDGYTVSFPDAWYTNTEIGDVPACSWFTPGFFEVTEFGTTPDEIWISLGTIDSGFGYIGTTEVFASEVLAIGGLEGRRLEYNPSPMFDPDYRGYHYVIDLAELHAVGPTFIAQTDNETAADYALAKAVLDRIIASLRWTDAER